MHTKLDTYFKGTLSIDCTSITITETKTGKEICNSPGTLYQDKDGLLTVKAYSNQNLFTFDSLFSKTPKAGELIGLDNYSIIAQSFSGEIWTGYSHGLAHNSGSQGTVITVRFYKISKTIKLSSKGSSLQLTLSPVDYFPSFQGRKLEAVRNAELVTIHGTNEATVTINNLNINFIKDGSLLGVTCNVTDPKYEDIISETLQWRIVESLQFFLGIRLHLLKTVFLANGELKTELYSKNNDAKQKILPPLNLHSAIDKWGLFSCYFTKCLEEKGDHFHPLSRQINSLLNASGASMEGQLLTMSVAIEGLISGYFDSVKDKNNISKELVKKMLEVLLKSKLLSADQYKRTEGVTKILLSSNVSDNLRKMQSIGLIEEPMIKVWKDIRNKAAHGTLECSDIEKCYDAQRKMTVLFYHLIFLVIGYHGPYTDYSEIGFPIKQFEKTVNSTAQTQI